MITAPLQTWKGCRHLLCIRADNMGDVIMTTPALRALKQSFNCRITLLTSSMGQLAAPFIPEVDELIVADLPWVKSNLTEGEQAIASLIERIRKENFDGAVIFTVYSQSALPAALLAYMAGIPRRLACCRENPYALLTDWLPDKEPYQFVQHQVERDLQLVQSIGASTGSDRLHLEVKEADRHSLQLKLAQAGVDTSRPFLLFHPGVSEEKRLYPTAYWIAAGAKLTKEKQILVTGTASERSLTHAIAEGISANAFDMAGLLSIGEFIAAIDAARLVLSVNTSTVHIAAARQTPVVVLYANTNPQHTPWKVPSRVLPFSVPEKLKSKNEIIAWLNNRLYRDFVPFPEPETVIDAIAELYKVTELTGTNIVDKV
jgi:ADP-heptose:LPS heptosyltransferase